MAIKLHVNYRNDKIKCQYMLIIWCWPSFALELLYCLVINCLMTNYLIHIFSQVWILLGTDFNEVLRYAQEYVIHYWMNLQCFLCCHVFLECPWNLWGHMNLSVVGEFCLKHGPTTLAREQDCCIKYLDISRIHLRVLHFFS